MVQAFFDEGGCRIAVVLDKEARVWNVTRGEPATPLLKHRARVNGAAFSRDGRRVVTASEDGTAKVWDAVTGEPVTPPLHHGIARENHSYSAHDRSDVPQASFSPDGRRLITVGWSAAQNWNLRPDERPAEDLVRLAVLLSGHQIDNSSGCVPVSKDVLVEAWKTLRSKYPRGIHDFPRRIARMADTKQADAAAARGVNAFRPSSDSFWPRVCIIRVSDRSWRARGCQRLSGKGSRVTGCGRG
jgi:WD40 repeat protein